MGDATDARSPNETNHFPLFVILNGTYGRDGDAGGIDPENDTMALFYGTFLSLLSPRDAAPKSPFLGLRRTSTP